MNSINGFRGENYFLSNFYRTKVVYDGLEYPTAEHAFQAAKCTNSQDKEKIRTTKSSQMAKRLGRKVLLISNWDKNKNSIMESILRAKFQQLPLKQLLKNTDNRQLIEENKWHDIYWGVCKCSKHKSNGQNILGTLLMKIRDEI